MALPRVLTVVNGAKAMLVPVSVSTGAAQASSVVATNNAGFLDPSLTSAVAAPAYAASLALNFATGTVQKLTLTGNPTLSFSGMVAGGHYLLELTQDSTGSRTVTWPSGIRWQGGSAPTLTTTASKTDLVALIYDGSSTFAQAALNF